MSLSHRRSRRLRIHTPYRSLAIPSAHPHSRTSFNLNLVAREVRAFGGRTRRSSIKILHRQSPIKVHPTRGRKLGHLTISLPLTRIGNSDVIACAELRPFHEGKLSNVGDFMRRKCPGVDESHFLPLKLPKSPENGSTKTNVDGAQFVFLVLEASLPTFKSSFS